MDKPMTKGEFDLVMFCLCFVSLHCADKKVRTKAGKLLNKLRKTK